MRLKTFAVAVYAAMAMAAFAQNQRLFESTWTGFDVGTYGTGRFPQAMAVGDINGDGLPDVVSTNGDFFNKTWAAVLNKGDGIFGSPTMYAGTEASDGIALADIDADGDLDVVRAESELYGQGTNIAIHRNNGLGVFGAGQLVAAGAGPAGIATGDFDADGWTDLAVCNQGYIGAGTTVTVLYGDTLAAFTRRQVLTVGNAPREVKAADLNGDGRLDLAIARDSNSSFQTKLVIALNEGANFGTPTIYAAAPGQNYASNVYANLAIGDMDRDGRPDIVFSSVRTWDGLNGGFLLFQNVGGGQFGAPQYQGFGITYTAGPSSTEVVDLNGDGWLDIVSTHFSDVPSGGFFVLLRSSTGGYPAATHYPAARGAFQVIVRDIDADGAKDVLIANYYSFELTVHRSRSNGTLERTIPSQGASSHDTVEFGDADNDGDLDALTSGGGCAILLSNGLGQFGPPTSYPSEPGRPAGGAKLRDIDADGIPDILFADWNGPNGVFLYARWRRGNGNGTFGPIQPTPIGFDNPADIDAVDFNGDGQLDIVVASPYENKFLIGRNFGFGTFVTVTNVPLGAPPQQVVMGDFNRDGKLDLAAPCYAPYGYDHRVAVVLGNGDATFGTSTLYDVDDGPYSMAAGDVNGDGFLDLVTANQGYQNDPEPSISVLLGLSNGAFQSERRILHSAVDDPRSTIIADVDGDLRMDLLILNRGNDVSFLKGRGDGTFERGVKYGVGLNPQTFQYKDLDRDGIRDLGALTITRLQGISEVSVIKGATLWETVAPDELSLSFGQVESGGLASLALSDDQRLRIIAAMNGSRNSPNVKLETSGISPISQPAQITLELEAACTLSPAGQVLQRIELFNFSSGKWVQLDQRFSTIIDSVTSCTISSQAGQFVQPGTGRMRAQLTWFDGFHSNRTSGSQIDRFVWRVR